MKNIIVLCNWNSCRSQLAEAYLQLFWKERFNVVSAWINPHWIHPFTIKVLKEDWIDFSNKKSKHVSEFTDREFDYIITVCNKAKETCPFFPWNWVRIHKSFEDPASFNWGSDEKLIFFRKIRDEIKEFSKDFINNN